MYGCMYGCILYSMLPTFEVMYKKVSYKQLEENKVSQYSFGVCFLFLYIVLYIFIWNT